MCPTYNTTPPPLWDGKCVCYSSCYLWNFTLYIRYTVEHDDYSCSFLLLLLFFSSENLCLLEEKVQPLVVGWRRCRLVLLDGLRDCLHVGGAWVSYQVPTAGGHIPPHIPSPIGNPLYVWSIELVGPSLQSPRTITR